MDEALQDKLIQEARLGKQAESVFSHELTQEILQSMKDRVWAAFSKTPLDDPDTLVGLRHMLNAIEAFESNFQDFVDTGKLAQAKLDEEGHDEDVA